MKILPSFLRWYRDHSESIDAFALDIDGVLINGRKALAGAHQLLDILHEDKIPYVLLTNDGSNSPEEKCRGFTRCALGFKKEDIISSSHPLEELAAARHLIGKKVFAMGSLGKPSYVKLAGMIPVRELDKLSGCVAVVMGERNYDWEKTINAVINHLANDPSIPLIVPNPDVYFLDGHERITLGTGAVARIITETLADRRITIEPIFLGKPHSPIFEHGHAVLELRNGKPIERKRVMMIGDSLWGDIAGAKNFGYSASLVLTGVTVSRMLAGSRTIPDLVFRGL